MHQSLSLCCGISYVIKNITATVKTQLRTLLYHVALSFGLSFLAKPSAKEKDEVST